VKKITTKQGDDMAVFTLEDLSGIAEVLVFPKSYAKFAEFIMPEAKVLVRGKYDTRDEERQVLLNHLFELSHVPVLHVELAPQASTQTVLQILDVLGALRGSAPLALHLPDGTCVMADDAYWVRVEKHQKLLAVLQAIPDVARARFEPASGRVAVPVGE
jgi:DNA polymerase III alpha subunit